MAVPRTNLIRSLKALYDYLDATISAVAVTVTGAVTAATGVFSGAITAASIALTGAVTAATVAATGAITGKYRMNRGANVAAAGSIQGDAAQLLEGFQVVTGADGTKGVKLPTAVAGMIVIIKGTTAAVLKVWPDTGAAINAVAANSAYSMASGVLPQMFIADSAAQWYTLPLVAS